MVHVTDGQTVCDYVAASKGDTFGLLLLRMTVHVRKAWGCCCITEDMTSALVFSLHTVFQWLKHLGARSVILRAWSLYRDTPMILGLTKILLRPGVRQN